MKITFLGTGAAPSYPLPFCRCPNCTEAWKRGGKDFRKRSSVLINDDLLIDMGPDLMAACALYGRPTTALRFHLQTHAHSDHFDPQTFTTRIPEYVGTDTPRLDVVGSAGTLARMSAMVRGEGYVDDFLAPDAQARMSLAVVPAVAGRPMSVGSYRIIPFATNHDAAGESMSYVVMENGFTFYYCTDTDVLPEETWAGFHANKVRFDAVALDHTYGPGTDSGGHLTAERFLEQIERMKREGLLAAGARILATHISHEGNPPHEEFSRYAAARGYEVAYDGLVIAR